MEKLNFEQMECVKGDGCLGALAWFAVSTTFFCLALTNPATTALAMAGSTAGFLWGDASAVYACMFNTPIG